MMSANEPHLVVTDLHPRVTGVGTTIRTLVPYIDEQEPLALVASVPHEARSRYSLWKAYQLCRKKPVHRPFRIWHARRNQEMLWGLVFKHLLGCPLKLVMTSAAIRRHSWFPRQLLARMDAIIATSEQAAGFVPNVVATIPHGVDCRRFAPPENRHEAFRQLNLPGQYGISIVGRVRPEKGTDLFVQAMIRLLPRYPEFTACIVGRAKVEHQAFQNDLARQIADAGLERRIIWMGEIDYARMPAFHQAMSLCVAPARYEGYGLVPLEAMACGVPVVASRTGAYPRIVDEGVTGRLADCNDLDSLVQALEPLLRSPAQLTAMGPACRQRVEDQFSARREAEQIVDVYRQIWSDAA